MGTPPQADGSPDLTFVRQVAEAVAEHMNGYKVVVTKSTVPIGTGKMIADIIGRGQRAVRVLDRLEPGVPARGLGHQRLPPSRPHRDRRSDARAIEIMKESLQARSSIRETPFVITDVASAELIKYASNGFLARQDLASSTRSRTSAS